MATKMVNARTNFIDDEDDLSLDEWDGLLITEWFQADPGALVPASSRFGEFKYAHQNTAAWVFVKLPSSLSILEAMNKIVTEARHLPGKHNQSTHGKGGKAAAVGKDDPDMMVMSRADVHPFGNSWQASDDMEKRAGSLWSESYAGHKQVTKAVANNQAGKPTLEGVDVEKGHKYTLLQAGAKDMPDGSRTEGMYKKKNLEADIKNSAHVLQSKLDSATTHNSPLYRGLLMNRNQLPKEGDTFDTPISSWAKARNTAEVYAYASPEPSLGITGDHAVVMRMVGPKKSADIGDIVGTGIMDDEHIVSGKIRIRRVTRKGKSVNIEVEQDNG